MGRGDAEFFNWLEANLEGLMARDATLLLEAVAAAAPPKPQSSPPMKRSKASGPC